MRTAIADGDKRLKTGWIVTVALPSIHRHFRATNQTDALLLARSYEQCLTLVSIHILYNGDLFATYTKEEGLKMGIISKFNALSQTPFANKAELAEAGTAFFITDIRSAASKQTGNKVWYMDIITSGGELFVLSQDSAPYRDPLVYGLSEELGINPDEKHTKDAEASYGPVRLVKKGRMYDLVDIEDEYPLPSTLF